MLHTLKQVALNHFFDYESFVAYARKYHAKHIDDEPSDIPAVSTWWVNDLTDGYRTIRGDALVAERDRNVAIMRERYKDYDNARTD